MYMAMFSFNPPLPSPKSWKTMLPVSPGDVLYFVARDNITASATVDLDATEVHTDSQTSASYLSDCPPMIFNDELLERDCNCIFTGLKRFKINMHIIPFTRGNPRLQQIVQSRGGPQDFDDINDVRNAFTAYRSIHIEFDSSFVVILVVKYDSYPQFGLLIVNCRPQMIYSIITTFQRQPPLLQTVISDPPMKFSTLFNI
ncbi:hypothetical protein QCA50_017530 [Cerrena zonata]|uniref:Uncharacterized protein n=1 Tax=Cerrena zonata TaxID=2478898 RepID=A0AAW0FFX7_9APHY